MDWPKVFTEDEFNYNTNDPNWAWCATLDGLRGWANVRELKKAGCRRPEFFGVGMVRITRTLGFIATPSALSNYAKQLLAEREVLGEEYD